MEYAFLTDDINSLRKLESSKLSLDSSIYGWLYDKTIEYIYFGNEFCEYRLPKVDEVIEAKNIASNLNCKFVLVTSPLSDNGLKSIHKLHNLVDNIVINDVAMFQYSKSKHLILGRMFDKLFHEFRADRDSLLEWEDFKITGTLPMVSKDFHDLLVDNDIERIEVDLVNHEMRFGNTDLKVSVYAPFSYLTTGRLCMFRGLQYTDGNKFIIHKNESCGQFCKNTNAVLHKNSVSLIQHGNTIFAKSDIDSLSGSNIDRFVIQDMKI